MHPADTALIVIDMQNDFCPGGALAVVGGDEIVPQINALMDDFATVILTQDWHPWAHSSFAETRPGSTPFTQIQMQYGPQTLWPRHCVQGSNGAAFHADLRTDPAQLIVRKGFRQGVDSYSALFENDQHVLGRRFRGTRRRVSLHRQPLRQRQTEHSGRTDLQRTTSRKRTGQWVELRHCENTFRGIVDSAGVTGGAEVVVAVGPESNRHSQPDEVRTCFKRCHSLGRAGLRTTVVSQLSSSQQEVILCRAKALSR